MPATKFTLPFLRKEEVAKDTYSFYFDKTKNPEFDYIPGQYVRMILPHKNSDDRGTSRFFTIASSPLIKEYTMHTTKIIRSSFKKTLLSLVPGQEVEFFAPLGSYILDEKESDPRIYLAGGVGLTPYHSMMTYSAAKNLSIPQTLFASFSTADEVIYLDELSSLNYKNKALHAIFTVTHPDEQTWKGETGRINEGLIKKHMNLTGQEIYYISGPMGMVDAMREMVQGMGVSEEKIRIEHFSGY